VSVPNKEFSVEELHFGNCSVGIACVCSDADVVTKDELGICAWTADIYGWSNILAFTILMVVIFEVED